MSEDEIVEILEGSVDAALSELGEGIKKAIYYHLEHEFGLKVKDIPYNLTLLSKGLRFLLGDGALTVERMIIRRFQAEAARRNLKPEEVIKVIKELGRSSQQP